MFKKIRLFSVFILVIMALLVITITPALASSAPISKNTLSHNQTMYYWSGSGGCLNASPYGIKLHASYKNLSDISTGYYFSGSTHTMFASSNQASTEWTKKSGPQGTFKFFITNENDTNSCTVNSGTIYWSMSY